jgi:hypothetical protein
MTRGCVFTRNQSSYGLLFLYWSVFSSNILRVNPCRLMRIQKLKSALQKKTRLLAKTDLAYWRRRLRKRPISANWFAEISARGVRRKLSLETPNKESAAARARDIYQLARAVGWDAVLQKYRTRSFEAKSNLSVGQFIALAESVASVQKVTWQGYLTAFRRIVSDSFNLDLGKKKFDTHGGGNQEWVRRVDAVKLASVTPQKIQLLAAILCVGCFRAIR